ncbi:MAG: hypothetical protein MUO76_22360 [Anaerolineaceae bacterium]|nr:hypothetical protein [Anaerolineaceae bacterium]
MNDEDGGNQDNGQGASRDVGERSLALSQTNNLETIRKVYDVWRKEMRASGIHLVLGPQTDLTTDPRGSETWIHRARMQSGSTR